MAKRKIKDIVESVDSTIVDENKNVEETNIEQVSDTSENASIEKDENEENQIIFDLQNKLNEATEKYEQLLKEYDILDKKCSDFDIKNSELQFENSRLKVENQFLQNKIEKLSANNPNSSEQIKQPISNRPLNADIPVNLQRRQSFSKNYKDIIEEFNKSKNEYWN